MSWWEVPAGDFEVGSRKLWSTGQAYTQKQSLLTSTLGPEGLAVSTGLKHWAPYSGHAHVSRTHAQDFIGHHISGEGSNTVFSLQRSHPWLAHLSASWL